MQFKKIFSFVGLSFIISLFTWSFTLLYTKIFVSFNGSVKTGWPWVYKIEEGTSGIGGYNTEYYIRYFIADYLVWTVIGIVITWIILRKWINTEETEEKIEKNVDKSEEM